MEDLTYDRDLQIVTDGVEAAHFAVKGTESWFTFTRDMQSGRTYMHNAANFISFIRVAILVNPNLRLVEIWRLYFLGKYNPLHEDILPYPFFNKIQPTRRRKGKYGGQMVTTMRTLYSSLQQFMIHLNFELIATNLLVPSLFESWEQNELVSRATIFTNGEMEKFYRIADTRNDPNLERIAAYAALAISCLGRGCEMYKLNCDDLVDGQVEAIDVISFDVTRAHNRSTIHVDKCIMMDPYGVKLTKKWKQRLTTASNFVPSTSLWMQLQVPLHGEPKIGRKIGHKTTSNYGKEIGEQFSSSSNLT